MGVQLAVDDFGTGYSSLSYLSQFPINSLKIDKSFVQAIKSEQTDAPIICAVINMGRGLMQRVVAEGVETREQLAFLQSRGCDEGQGYYFSRPLVAEQFAKLLETGLSATVLNKRLSHRCSSRISLTFRDPSIAVALRKRRNDCHAAKAPPPPSETSAKIRELPLGGTTQRAGRPA